MGGSLTGLAGSLMTAKKGVTQAQLEAVITFIKRQGLAQSTLQCDGELALVKLVEEIGKQTSLPTRQSPAYSHQSQAYVEGWHRSLFAQFRALLFDFCHRYKLEPSEIKMGGSFSQHMLRHAVWLLIAFSFIRAIKRQASSEDGECLSATLSYLSGSLFLLKHNMLRVQSLTTDYSLKEAWLSGLEDAKRPVSTS